MNPLPATIWYEKAKRKGGEISEQVLIIPLEYLNLNRGLHFCLKMFDNFHHRKLQPSI